MLMPRCKGHNIKYLYEYLTLQQRQTIKGITLIELIVVLSVVGILLLISGIGLGSVSFAREDAFVRRLSATLEFLHHQAVVDRVYYGVRFNLDTETYDVGLLSSDANVNRNLAVSSGASVGNLTIELSDFLTPFTDDGENFIPPPAYPSLAEPQTLPQGATFSKIKTSQLELDNGLGGSLVIPFSPLGFSEFAVIHLRFESGREVTILLDPFTGNVTTYNDNRDFQWIYGQQ